MDMGRKELVNVEGIVFLGWSLFGTLVSAGGDGDP